MVKKSGHALPSWTRTATKWDKYQCKSVTGQESLTIKKQELSKDSVLDFFSHGSCIWQNRKLVIGKHTTMKYNYKWNEICYNSSWTLWKDAEIVKWPL